MSIRSIITLLVFISISPAIYALETVWKDQQGASTQSSERLFVLDNQTLVSQIDHSLLTSAKGYSRSSSANLTLPLPNGEMVRLRATEYSIMEEGAVASNGFRSWKVVGVDDPAVYGVIDVSGSGFHGMLVLEDGNTIFIEPEQQEKSLYRAFNKSGHHVEHAFSCDVHSSTNGLAKLDKASNKPIATALRSANAIKTYRLAMAATGEFTQLFGSKAATESAINTMISRINLIYKRDLGIELRLIANNSDLIFTNPNTDRYTGTSVTTLIDENTPELNRVVGEGAYDIGHVLTRAGGGFATLGSVCSNVKGAGVTGTSRPDDPTFAIDFVAHELGHQLGATHTFNSLTGNCGGGNRQAISAYEPGSGSSVMAYANICGVNNIASQSLPVFHVASIAQIDTKTLGDCSGITGISNRDPVITNITRNLSINVGDSFTLTGSATDPDTGDSLTYTWDQFDAGKASDKFVDTGDNALFEVTVPSSSASRTFSGRAVTNRNLTFEFIVRDGNGGITSERTVVKVGDGPSSTGESGGSGTVSYRLLLMLVLLSVLTRYRKN